MKGWDQLVKLDLGTKTPLKWILTELGCEDLGWIHLVHDSV